MKPTLRPKFKSLFFVRRAPDGRLRVAETFPDRAAEIEDEDGLVSRLIPLMDGTRTVEDLWKELLPGNPELLYREVAGIVEELDSAGFLDDAALQHQTSFQPKELERYKANLQFFSYFSNLSHCAYQMQERLKDARITIIGIGSLGAGVLFNLAGLGVSKVRIIDFDRIDLSNLNRQMLYNEQDIGRLKIDAASDYIGRFNSVMQLERRNIEIQSAESAKLAIAGSDLIVLAADQPHFQLERWVNEACVELRIPFIGGGLQVVEGTFYTFIPGKTGCLECNHLISDQRDDRRSVFMQDLAASGFRMPSSAIAPNYMVLIGAVSGEIVRYFTGIADLRSAGRVVSIDFLTCVVTDKMDFSKPVSSCSVCGGGGGKHAD